MRVPAIHYPIRMGRVALRRDCPAPTCGSVAFMSLLPEVPDGHLRVTVGQRDNAVAILREAAADGRLDFDELDQRVGDALGARTRDDLARVLTDLVPASGLGTAVERPVPVGEGPGYRWEEPLLIEGGALWSTILRGVWEVPPFLEVNTGFFASVRLDMTHATCRTRVIDLVINSSGGTITLVVPEGWGVDTQGVKTSSLPYTISSRLPTRPSHGAPRIMVRGRTSGRLSVRNPTRRELTCKS